MELFDAIHARHTTNGPFADRPVAPEDKRQLLELAARAPSHFNSQPWRFVVVEDEARRAMIGRIAGEAMRQMIEEGTFWQQYRRYFRFSQEEADATSDGILIDQMPAVLRPFVKQLFTERGGRMMNALQVPRVLGNDQRRLVERSPLLLGLCLARGEYRPGQLSGLYSLVSLGAVVQTIWLAATALGMGVQFVSAPQEVPAAWAEVARSLGVPDDYELMLLFRLGYVADAAKRPAIDWTSPQRKRIADLAFQEEWGQPLE